MSLFNYFSICETYCTLSIQLKLLLNDAGQPIDSPSEVGVAAGNIDLVGSSKIIQHSTVGSAAPWT